MTQRTIALDDLKTRSIEDVLREVAAEQEELTVRLPEGESITIRPSPRLKPLPVFPGRVPEGWKDVING
jgi:hypothetical protein